MTYLVQDTHNCCFPEKKNGKVQNQAAAGCTGTDGQTLRSFFLRDNHHLLLAQLFSARTRVIASRYRPSTVPHQSGGSTDANTNMTTFSMPVSLIKPRRSWATADDCNPLILPRALNVIQLDTLALGVLGGVSGLGMLHGFNRTSAKHVRVSSDKLKQDTIIEGADVSTQTTDDAVPFRVPLTDAHSA